MKRDTLVSILLGMVAATLMAYTTDQIWQSVYNVSSNAIQVTTVNASGTPVAGGLTVGSSAITNGTNGLCLYDNTGVLGEQACGGGAITNLSFSGKLNETSITSISASATPAAADLYIRCTSGSSADQTYTLPAATGTGRVLTIKKIDSGTKSCIVARAGSDLIDGQTSVTLSAQYQDVTVFDAASAVWDIR